MSREAAPRRVLFLGDSLVAGVGDPAGGGWVARVVSACSEQRRPVTAYNLGIRRETSLQAAARWRAEAAPRVPPGVDARIVLSFGANDTTVERGAVRVPAAGSRRALSEILAAARALGLAAFVVGPAPVDDAEQNRRIGALTAIFAEVCAEYATPFAGVLEPLLESSVWMSEVATGDGAHPGAAGYQALAELLLERGLLAWLIEPSESPPFAIDRGGPPVQDEIAAEPRLEADRALVLPGGQLLRLVDEPDAPELHAAVAANRDSLARWLAWAADQTLADTFEFVRRARCQFAEGDGLQAAVVDRGAIVGMVGFPRVSRAHRSAGIGYWLVESARGRGIVTRAVAALVDHAFGVWGLNRVEIRAGVENLRSRAVPQRLGFTEEGVLREAELVGERYVDLAVYGMLAADWPEPVPDIAK
jgi:acyl-CoA thioesterase I